MTDYLQLPLRDEEGSFHVVVEAPRGSAVKTKYDPGMNAFVFERPLRLGVVYPYDWGFFPSTIADDGDPLDAMVLFDHGTWPGVVVRSTPIGIVRIKQRRAREKRPTTNDRVIVVPTRDDRVRHVRDLSRTSVAELEDFIVLSGKMAGKEVVVKGWAGPEAARRAIVAAAEKYLGRARPPKK